MHDDDGSARTLQMADDGREAELRDAFVQASSGQVGLLVLLVIVNLTVLWVLWSILSGN